MDDGEGACLIPVILPVHTTYEDGTERSETSAYTIQTPGNRPKERIQHSEHSESLKSRITPYLFNYVFATNQVTISKLSAL